MPENLSVVHLFSDSIYEAHLHNNYELYLVLSDGVTIETENDIFEASKGSLFIFAPLSFHKITSGGTKFERYILSFDERAILGELNCLEKYFFLYKRNKCTQYIFSDTELRKLSLIFDDGVSLSEHGVNTNELEKASMLLRVFAFLSRYEPCESHATHAESRMSDILRFTDENAADGINAGDIAEHFNIGTTTLYKLFKEALGTSPGDYLLHHRIKLAKEYLDRGMSVTEAANRSGFNSYSHFIRIFRQKTGLTPHRYSRRAPNFRW